MRLVKIIIHQLLTDLENGHYTGGLPASSFLSLLACHRTSLLFRKGSGQDPNNVSEGNGFFFVNLDSSTSRHPPQSES